ncbi:MAG: hypothetical protein V4496_00915 [Pseudomonadota bacterium]
MSLFENSPPRVDANVASIDFSAPEVLTAIAQIENNEMLFVQLQRAKDIPSQFLPESKDYCLVVSDTPAHTGELSSEVMNQINAFARAHIADPKHARWLLVHTWPANSDRPQSTLVCFIQHFEPNALVDNTEGAGVANQIVAALQALQGEGLVTTNINYELIRKMSKNFGVLFGGSFSDLANRLRVHSVDQSVRKSEKVAHEKGLFTPAPAPAASLGLGGVSDSIEDENP